MCVSPVIQHFESGSQPGSQTLSSVYTLTGDLAECLGVRLRGDPIKICNRIIFDFYRLERIHFSLKVLVHIRLISVVFDVLFSSRTGSLCLCGWRL